MKIFCLLLSLFIYTIILCNIIQEKERLEQDNIALSNQLTGMYSKKEMIEILRYSYAKGQEDIILEKIK